MKREMNECGMRKAIVVTGGSPVSARDRRAARRHAMTLIELMVVIVILTILVGGVLPVLSPNNDARKIREAARGLQTFVMQAQARAARTGRPAGIAFRESSAGSGVALEVHQIEVPPPFAGFSQYSAGRIRQDLVNPNNLWIQLVQTNTLDPTVPIGGNRFNLLEYEGFDAVPPGFIKKGDIVRTGGVEVRLTVPEGDENEWLDDEGYYVWDKVLSNHPEALIPCELVNPTLTLPIVEPPYREVQSGPQYGITAVKPYTIDRQPKAVGASAVPPYQLPAGVCIDLQASGTEGGARPTQFAAALTQGDRFTPTAADPARIKQIGILFSPNGGIDKISYNGTEFNSVATQKVNNDPARFVVKANEYLGPITDASRICLLLARVENANVPGITERRDGEKGYAWDLRIQDSKERIADVQRRVNWLNLDSRWMVMDARNGRMSIAENMYVDAKVIQSQPRPGGGGTQGATTGIQGIFTQAELARSLARNMQGSDGDQ